ncbi:MAG: polysaccharide pyruvyl transferase CsaB [Bacillota bacterium]
MKTVVISGYYGYDNIGDEALLQAIVEPLREMVPDIRIIVLSAQPAKTARQYNVEAEDRFSPLRIFSALKKADLLISGGGSLLQDVTGPFTIPYYLSIVALAKMLGKPVMFYAQGVGPVNRGFSKTIVRLVADRADIITLRDEESKEILHQLEVRRPPITVTADPVFGLSGDGETGNLLQQFGLTKGPKPMAAIAAREWQGLTGYKTALAAAADYLAAGGWDIVLLPMQFPADLKTCEDIRNLMRQPAKVIDRHPGVNELMSITREFDLLIGMRLHALIFAAANLVPLIGLSYDPKVWQFMEQVKQPVISDISEVTAEMLMKNIDDVVSKKDEIKKELAAITALLRERAKENSIQAMKILLRN